jgi:hypothetical protein
MRDCQDLHNCDATRCSDQRIAVEGAYTTARTVNRTSVFDLTFHINRLAETARLMAQAPAQPGVDQPSEKWTSELLSADSLRPLVIRTLRSAISQYERLHPEDRGDLKLTVLTHAEDGNAKVCAHVSPLPPRPQQPVKIQVRMLIPLAPGTRVSFAILIKAAC